MSQRNKNRIIEITSLINLSDAQIAMINDGIENVRISTFPRSTAEQIPAEQWAKTEVLLSAGDYLPTREMAPKLKWIQISFAGVDPILNRAIIHDENIQVTSASGVMVSQMGEYILMALLMLGHKMPAIINAQLKNEWISNKSGMVMPKELRGSTVGIIGYGSIGRELARLLYHFGAKVLATKADLSNLEDTGYIPEGLGDPHGDYFYRMYPTDALLGMLPECDFVVLTAPLTEKTRNMFSTEAFAAMKPSAYFINVSRGALVDESALVVALRNKTIAGAMLDVFNEEPLPANNPLWKQPNLIITPHVSGVSPKILDNVLRFFNTNLKRYRDDLPLYNVIDPKRGY